MTDILTQEQIQAKLKEIAEREQEVHEMKSTHLSQAKATKELLENQLEQVKKQIKFLETGKADVLRAELKTTFNAHLQAGGDPKIHDRVEVRRNKKWMYDQKAALAWAQEHGIRDVIRVKEALDKRAMDKLVQEGHYPDAEEVHSVSIVLPSMLGDLLISNTD